MLGFSPTKRFSFSRPAALSLGAFSILGQVLLMRELVTSFYGNEMVYALLLSCWLFWVAAGSFLCGRFLPRVSAGRFVSTAFVILGGLLPLTVLTARLSKNVWNIPTGQIVGLLPISLTAFVILAPLCLVCGGTYAVLCRAESEDLDGNPVARVGGLYQKEALGSALGGAAFSFVLVWALPALHISVFAALAAFACAFYFAEKKFKHLPVVAVVVLFGLLYPGTSRLDSWVRDKQWRGLRVVEVRDSIYGNLTLTKDEQNYHLFENGLLSLSTRSVQASEELVHLALQGRDVGRVLLLGNGLGGILSELLKYPGLTVEYVELDPEVLDLARDHLPSDLLAVLDNTRVRTQRVDARLLVKITDERYDALILNMGDPSSALINRYYTREFYEEARRVLTADGVIAFSVSSSFNYLNDENKNFLRSVHSTLGTVFEDVRSVPGDSHVFLAALRPGVIDMDYEGIAAALAKNGINTEYFTLDLPSRMNALRLQQIDRILQEPGRVNQDLKPIAYLYDVLLWSTHFNTAVRNAFERLRGLTLAHLMVVPALVLLAGLWLRRWVRGWAVDLSIVTTGFSEIVFQILVILAFQSLYGFVYYRVGLIMASFMAGLVLGVAAAQKTIIHAPDKARLRYYQTQALICVYPLVLPLVFAFLAGSRAGTLPLAPLVFTLLPIVAGAIGGFQYPLAVQLKSRAGQATAAAPALYALDVLGAAIGALVTATILIPLLGVTAVAVFCAVLNAVVLVLLMGSER